MAKLHRPCLHDWRGLFSGFPVFFDSAVASLTLHLSPFVVGTRSAAPVSQFGLGSLLPGPTVRRRPGGHWRPLGWQAGGSGRLLRTRGRRTVSCRAVTREEISGLGYSRRSSDSPVNCQDGGFSVIDGFSSAFYSEICVDGVLGRTRHQMAVEDSRFARAAVRGGPRLAIICCGVRRTEWRSLA